MARDLISAGYRQRRGAACGKGGEGMVVRLLGGRTGKKEVEGKQACEDGA